MYMQHLVEGISVTRIYLIALVLMQRRTCTSVGIGEGM